MKKPSEHVRNEVQNEHSQSHELNPHTENMGEGTTKHMEGDNQGCTKCPIENYITYGKLSPAYKAFVQKLDHV